MDPITFSSGIYSTLMCCRHSIRSTIRAAYRRQQTLLFVRIRHSLTQDCYCMCDEVSALNTDRPNVTQALNQEGKAGSRRQSRSRLWWIRRHREGDPGDNHDKRKTATRYTITVKTISFTTPIQMAFGVNINIKWDGSETSWPRLHLLGPSRGQSLPSPWCSTYTLVQR